MKFSIKKVLSCFLMDKKTVEKLEGTNTGEELSIIESHGPLSNPLVSTTDAGVSSSLNTIKVGSEIQRLQNIQYRTKKQRSKKKLQKRIDVYEK